MDGRRCCAAPNEQRLADGRDDVWHGTSRVRHERHEQRLVVCSQLYVVATQKQQKTRKWQMIRVFIPKFTYNVSVLRKQMTNIGKWQKTSQLRWHLYNRPTKEPSNVKHQLGDIVKLAVWVRKLCQNGPSARGRDPLQSIYHQYIQLLFNVARVLDAWCAPTMYVYSTKFSHPHRIGCVCKYMTKVSWQDVIRSVPFYFLFYNRYYMSYNLR